MKGITLAILLSLLIFTSALSAQTHELVSKSSDGVQGDSLSMGPSISSTGQYVAFRSSSSNLVPGDLNETTDVFVRDRDTNKTEKISITSSGIAADGANNFPAITRDGRYVAFQSWATNLTGTDTNNSPDIFLHDRNTHSTERISKPIAGTFADKGSNYCAISDDGRYVSFDSQATNLVSDDINGVSDIFIRDSQSGVTKLVSVDSNGMQGDKSSIYRSSMSGDGRYVAFQSDATNLVSDDTNGVRDIFVHDLDTRKTERVSIATDGTQGDKKSLNPAISSDGKYVAFRSDATNLVSGDSKAKADIFVHDRETHITTRVSVDSSGTEANDNSAKPSISDDGRYVTFESVASNLGPSNTTRRWLIYVHDRQTGKTSRISQLSDGTLANDDSYHSVISGNGTLVAYETEADNLVTNDSNDAYDIVVSTNATDTPDSQPFLINAGLNGSWYNPATNGQGFYIEVLPDLGLMALAWFTYDTERPDESVPSSLGGAGQRWLTALGAYADDTVVLDIEVTKGGVFDQLPPLTTSELDGTIIFKFIDCKTATLTYDIPSIGRENTIPLQRIAFDNVALCEALAETE